MYAIVDIAGKQYKLAKDEAVNVDRLAGEAGSEIVFDKVLLLADGANISIGQPYLSNVTVKAQLLGEFKAKKVRGIKFKKRKNYARVLGHRQIYSKIKVNDLVVA